MGGWNVSRRLGFLLFAAAIAAGGCTSAKGEPPEVRKLQARAAFERGLVAFRDKQASLALSAFREAIDIDPSAADYPNALGLLYLELRRPDLALAEFAKATALDPKFADAQVNRGIALAEQRRWEEAVGAYRTALTLPAIGSSYLVYNNLGLALYSLGRLQEAEDTLRFAINLEPSQEPAYYHLGLVLVALGRPEEAKMAYRQARLIAPESPFGQAAAARLRDLGEAMPAPSDPEPKRAPK
ncbi:MAG TPA: hypothetical protein DDZ42_01940 [Candidatus Rokubacteria bacterium]|nr:hypothetical protein [Candidatus Rokubacteria bacterium]